MPIPAAIIQQFVQYAIVGGTAFLVDFGTLYVLTTYMELNYLYSATAGFLLGLVVNYRSCVRWVVQFRALDNRIHEFTIFAGIGIVGLLLNALVLFVLTDHVHLHYLESKIIAAGLILGFNFSLRRIMLFTNRRPNNIRYSPTVRSDILTGTVLPQ